MRRAARELDKLVLQLIAMTEAEIRALPVSESLQRELNVARELRSHSARRRQLRYAAGMLRASPAEVAAIRGFFETGARVRPDPLADVRRLEAWRAALCTAERFEAALVEVEAEFPHIDRAAVARLARAVMDDPADDKAYRELFKRLRAAADEKEAEKEAE